MPCCRTTGTGRPCGGAYVREWTDGKLYCIVHWPERETPTRKRGTRKTAGFQVFDLCAKIAVRALRGEPIPPEAAADLRELVVDAEERGAEIPRVLSVRWPT